MKLRNASVNMALGICMVRATMMGPMALGMRWRTRIFRVGTPSRTAAETNSCSRMVSTWERTMRTMPTQ